MSKEEKALNSAESAYVYAKLVLKGRFEKGEDVISEHPYYSFLYALHILNGRFKKGEKAISKDDYYSYLYARDVLKDRFKKGEDAISKDAEYSELYRENVYDAEKDKLDKLIEASKALINILSNDENDYPDSSTYRMIMDKCSAVQEVLNEIK